jgi:hypothetical protein
MPENGSSVRILTYVDLRFSRALVHRCGLVKRSHLLAQSFSPFLSQDGRQVCRPDPTRATNLFR